jgi:hypothetical protein
VEEPLRFDIWCECERVNRKAVADYLRCLSLEPPVGGPDSKRLTGRRMVLKFLARPWRVVEAFRSSPAPWFGPVRVYQQFYGPEQAELLHHCEAHDLYYAGVIGCHVCTGFYQT